MTEELTNDFTTSKKSLSPIDVQREISDDGSGIVCGSLEVSIYVVRWNS